MARSPDGKLTSIADAKARLLECGTNAPASSTFLASPIVRVGAALAAGTLLGVLLRRRGKGVVGSSSLINAAARSILAVAPLLVEQLVKSTSSTGSTPRNPS